MTNTPPFTLVEQLEAFKKFAAIGLDFVVPGMGLYGGPCSHHHPTHYNAPESILENFLSMDPLARKVVAGETTYAAQVNPILERYNSYSSKVCVPQKDEGFDAMVQRVLGSLNHVGHDTVKIDYFLTGSRRDMIKSMDKQYLQTGLAMGGITGLFVYATIDTAAAPLLPIAALAVFIPAIGRDNARYPLHIEHSRLTSAAQNTDEFLQGIYGVKR